MSELTAYTEEEAREVFLKHVLMVANEWARIGREKGKTPRDVARGTAFSILCILDGVSGGHPGCKVTIEPHEDDKAYHLENGERWYEPGTEITGGSLHEELGKYDR